MYMLDTYKRFIATGGVGRGGDNFDGPQSLKPGGSALKEDSFDSPDGAL